MFMLKKNLDILTLFLMLFIPSLRAIFKYLPQPELISVLIASILFVGSFVILQTQIIDKTINKQSSLWFVFVVILIFIVVTYIVYPIADARKFVGKGSTGDDAIIESAKQFLSSGHMYDVTLQDGVPVSPGPGWILMNSVFVYSGCYFLFTPAYVFASIALYFLIFGWGTAPIYLLTFLSTSLIFWELMVTGHDLVSIGFSLAIIVILLYHYCIASFREDFESFSIPILLISILIGFVSTSRIVFMFLPFLSGLLLSKTNFKCSVVVFVVSLSTAILLHAIFYFNTGGYYQPLHLFGRGESHVGLPLIIVGASCTFLLAIMAYLKVQNSFESFTKWFFMLLVVPLSFISFGEFLHVGNNFADWEGANYVVPAMPVYLLYISNKYASVLKTDAPTGK